MKQQKQKIKKGTVKRLLGYIKRKYKKQFIIVIICIILASIAMVGSSLFLRTLIDNYITPLLGTENPVFTELLKMVLGMAVIYLIGVVAGYIYNRKMAVIAQGVKRYKR